MSDFDALSAKLKAMRSLAFSSGEYEELLEKQTVGEAFLYLKKTPYGEFLSDLGEGDIHRGKIEERLDKRCDKIYTSLYLFSNPACRELVKFFKMRGLIDQIREDNIEDMAKKNNDERLSPVLNRQKRGDFGDIKASMMPDKIYYSELWRAISKFKIKEQREALKDYIGTQIDCMNIMRIYRCKRYFKTPPELIYTYLIPVYYRLSKEKIIETVRAEGELLGRDDLYFELFEGDENFLIEDNIKKFLTKRAKRAFALYPRTITEVFAFYDLFSIEVRNIKTIIEGIRYKTPPELIRKHIY